MKPFLLIAGVILALSCAGTQRDCAKGCSSQLGANWLLVQYSNEGRPISCWQLRDVPLREEEGGGVFWLASDGNLIHINGWYNNVQVERDNWHSAAVSLGIEIARCPGGTYVTTGLLAPEPR